VKRRRARLVLDRTTVAVLIAGVTVLNLLVFSAGWLMGGALTPRALTPRPPLPILPSPPAPGEGETYVASLARSSHPMPAQFEPSERATASSPGSERRRRVDPGLRNPKPPEPRRGDTWVSPLADVAAFVMPPKPKAAPRPRPVFRKVSLDLIHQAALSHSLPPALVEAVARVESGLNPRALSPKGARGLLQLMPATARRFGVRTDRLFEPEHNLAAGAAYLAWLLDRYDDNLDFALAAYNAGEGAVDDYGGIPPYRETQDYVRRVRAALRSIEAKALPLPDLEPVEEEKKKEEVDPEPAAPLTVGGQ
jgi:hypothetical protein